MYDNFTCVVAVQGFTQLCSFIHSFIHSFVYLHQAKNGTHTHKCKMLTVTVADVLLFVFRTYHHLHTIGDN